MTQVERREIEAAFAARFKPAIERWCSAYAGRLNFRPGDVSATNLVERLGKAASFYLYTFVVGDFTLVVQDSNGHARVSYLMSKTAAKGLNTRHAGTAPPDLSPPITREDVIGMIRADAGVQFKPNEIILRPTGAGTAMAGGAFVEVLPAGADPNNGLSSKIDMVFGQDGKLANYDRDPYF
ncbi:MAG TPA: hypothetical protein VHH88_07700 [Verrucomicrobiae bacterium]|nr:hypothetical protein [Verrucomicrobiae bacterium]